MMDKKPDRFFIDKKDREIYDKIGKELSEDFYQERKNQFLLAMAFGFRNEARQEIKSKEGGGFFRSEYLHSEEETLINAVAVYATDSVEILSNIEDVYKIAEEYAHGGIQILYNEVTSKQPGSFYKRFEKQLKESRVNNKK